MKFLFILAHLLWCQHRGHPHPFDILHTSGYEVHICTGCGNEWVLVQGALLPTEKHPDKEKIWQAVEAWYNTGTGRAVDAAASSHETNTES